MDALVAHYGTDDDSGDEEQGTPQPPPSSKPSPSLLKASESLSHPSAHSEPASAPPSRLFASLPPPKTHLLPHPPAQSPGHAPSQQQKVESNSSAPNPRPGPSLFSSLPRPKGSDVHPDGQKRVVRFVPPVATSLLGPGGAEAEDASRPPKIPRREDDASDARPAGGGGRPAAPPAATTGRLSFLPPPKHSAGLGAVLGGGSAGGQGARLAMDIGPATSAPPGANAKASLAEGTRSADRSGGAEQPAAAAHPAAQYAVPHWPPAPEPGQGIPSYGSGAPAPLTEAEGAAPPQDPYGSATYAVDYSQWQQQQGAAQPAGGAVDGEGVQDPLAAALAAETRRGKRGGAQVVEVKQAELTKSHKLRDDQLKATGIAIGPTYQPVSQSKDKPRKMEKRKHQITSLYHDMRQKEMELVDRRAKGQMTKAETQAKYGW